MDLRLRLQVLPLISHILGGRADALDCRRPHVWAPWGPTTHRRRVSPRCAGVWLYTAYREGAYVLLMPVLLPYYNCVRLYNYRRDMRTIFRLSAQVRVHRPQASTAVMNLHMHHTRTDT